MNFLDIFMKAPHLTKGVVGTSIGTNGSNENFDD
jgi:hypothetical protein